MNFLNADMPGHGALDFRVLVIDDDEIDRERVRRTLAKAGIEASVFEESDPHLALVNLRKASPDLIVLDYNFPKQDGLTVLRDLRELDHLVPVIMLTGHDDMTVAVELMKAGAVDYIPKSGLTPARLAQSVRHARRLRSSEFATRAAQEALRASEEFSRSVLDASADAIAVLDLGGHLSSLSSGGLRILGIDGLGSLRGKAWVSLWHEEHQGAVEAALEDARAGRSGHYLGALSWRGRTLWWDVVATPILGAAGRPERLLAIGRDVTQQRRKAEFEQQLIGIVSHDLRNPISSMIMAASLLESKLEQDPQLVDKARRIVSNGNRASRLIRDLLDFTQLRLGGGLPVMRSEADLHVVCKQTLDDVAISHQKRIIQLETSGDTSGLWDADRIAQCMENLARNALAYSAPDSPVKVTCRGHAEHVSIEVHNHGRPIPEDMIPTLFQPFKRGEKRHDPDRSLGLGLFIVREIVAGHGGTVEVRSSETAGTTFVLRLPRM